jgi:hypothetical protein
MGGPPLHIINMDLPKITHTTPSLVLPNPFPHHMDNNKQGKFYSTFPSSTSSNFEQLNTTNPPHQPNNNRERERIKTKDKGETPNNQTPQLGETKIRLTKTPKGEITMANQDKGETTTFKPTSLAHYAVSMVIILIISPKLLSTNG